MKILKYIISLLFPICCVACNAYRVTGSGQGICVDCHKKIHFITPPFCQTCGSPTLYSSKFCNQCRDDRFYFDQAFACSVFEREAKRLVYAFKFEHKRCLTSFFVNELTRFTERFIDQATVDCVAAIPMHPSKLRQRGYNHSREIAKGLSHRLGRPDYSAFIHKISPSQTQHFLSKKQRKINVKGAFKVQSGLCVMKNKNVLLIDDVLTSGQTASECAHALKIAGARRVTVLVWARGA